MGFNSAFKELKLLKTPGEWSLNNLNDPVLNVLKWIFSKEDGCVNGKRGGLI
jgi:hypothetical protein